MMSRLATIVLFALTVAASLAVPARAGLFDRHPRGNGELTTKTYDLDPCHAILLSCGLDLTIRLGDAQSVALTIDENLVEYYQIEARHGTLVIDADESPRPHRSARLDITLTSLDELEVAGAGDIDVRDYRGESLELRIDGAGDLEIDGTVGKLAVAVNGAGDVDARELEAREVEVAINGAGDVDVHATASADIEINGVGDVDVWGEPAQFAKSVHGIGDITRH